MANFIKNKVPSKISISVFFLLHLLFPLSQNQVDSYTPDYHLTVNCGSSRDVNTSESDNRTWLGDFDSNTKLFSINEPQTEHRSLKEEALNIPSSVLKVPYDSARLSLSNFTYSFPIVTNGPVFLRLHFYPTSYHNFESSNALFSVKVGNNNNNNNLTLLKDFNASLWVNEFERTVIKEYCIQMEAGETLSVTFLPSTNHSGVYAFVNGIEVVSMPPFLYYTNSSEFGNHIKHLGRDTDTPYEIHNDRALEMVYRINVGENQVPRNKDAGGMFRNWDNDGPYLEKEYPNSVPAGFGLDLNYKKVPNYTAPEEVYLTARSCGLDTLDNYNITWSFQVDSGFTYMVRLHFCEFDKLIQHLGDRVFQIFIADTLAEQQADVISWSGGNLIPTHKDYAVQNFLTTESEKRVNLTIKLQRLPPDMHTNTKILDVILNGIEIFKISDENNNLAGQNPNPMPLSNTSSPPHSSSKNNSKIIIAVVAVSTLALASSVIIIITVFVRRRISQSHFLDHMEDNSKKEGSSSLPSHLCRYFTIAEIRAATKNFDDVFIIGVGGFGNVYKGYIDGYTTPVAIKRLKPGSQQGVNEFMNEIELLSQLRHVHLVSLIGYCNDGAEMILVYDFMQRGTLREYLYGSDNECLSWKQRLDILLGAARGLHYLHAGAKHNIIHRDVKSTNILLDEKWVAKVSDFGLSKVGPTGNTTTHVSTMVKGSLGYLDPEYYLRQRLTLKSDVYSFGVVLLEVLCARPPLLRAIDKKKASLVGWFQKCHDEGMIEIEKIVDPFIRDCISAESLKCYCHVALSCLRDDGNERPTMSDGCLEFALQLVVSEEDKGGAHDETTWVPTSDEGSDVRFPSSDEYKSETSKMSSTVSGSTGEQPLFSSTVFSEIGNPTAR